MKHLLATAWMFLVAACATAPAPRPPDPPAPTSAFDARLAALRDRPDDEQLLRELVDAAVEHDELPRALSAIDGRRDALGLWFQGRVRYAMAEKEDAEAAFALLDAASASFESSQRANPMYGDSCEQWQAMCLGKKGNIAFRAGDVDRAGIWLLEATRLRPDRVGADLGGGDSVKLGLLRVGDKTMRDFERTETFFREAANVAAPDVDLLNNAAVYARDHAVRLGKAGRHAEAAEMFERSYETYLRTVALDPRSVPLRNDCALIAVHYLERDWDESKALLDAALADGERELVENPPTDARRLQDLDEAVGDCLENLALWHLKHDRDHEAAESFARRSLEHHPREKRGGARRHLEAAEKMRAQTSSPPNGGGR